jgi:hypothetical protein
MSVSVLGALMGPQLVTAVEAIATVPVTARFEALEYAHHGEVLLEVPDEVGMAFEGFTGIGVCAEKANWEIHVCLTYFLSVEKKNSPAFDRYARHKILVTEREIGVLLGHIEAGTCN